MRAARKPDSAVHLRDSSFAYFIAKELGEGLAIIRPFSLWPVVVIGAFLLRKFWPASEYVIGFIAIVSVLLSVFVWHQTRVRGVIGHIHGILTVLCVGALFGAIDVLGWTQFTGFMMLFGVPVLCLTWAIRGAVAERDDLNGGHLSALFDAAGMEGSKLKVDKPKADKKAKRSWPWQQAVEVEAPLPEGKQRRAKVDRKVTGTIHLAPGETTEELNKRLRNVESAGGLPPGTMLVRENIHHAGRADVTLSDPRAMLKPIQWPGPSYIGGSIADPISVGMYQDGTEAEFKVPETQIQIMGQVGSGKSLGAGWSALAEIVTRNDVIVWAIDIKKGLQTLGPLVPALHRVATNPEDAIELLQDADNLIKPRTNYLADYGLGKWRKDCGIKYFVIWLEEVPYIIEALGKKGQTLWTNAVKAARSAGMTFVWSLQRADFTQVPTITRGQAVKWCFGVADSHEGAFGLSKAQKDAGCSPELWGQRQPGMSYLDAPSVPDDKVAMPLRAWYWGEDDSIIREHAAKYSIRTRPYDGLMWSVLGSPDRKATVPVEADVQEADAEPAPKTASKPSKPGKMEPEQARAHMRAWLVGHAGEVVHIADVNAARAETGFGRQWGYKIMDEFVADDLVERVDSDTGVAWKIASTIEPE